MGLSVSDALMLICCECFLAPAEAVGSDDRISRNTISTSVCCLHRYVGISM